MLIFICGAYVCVRVLAAWLAEVAHVRDPARFCDQVWQLACHGAMLAWESRLLPMADPWQCNAREEWADFFEAQVSMWVFMLMLTVLVEIPRRDYVAMVLHHVLTISLTLVAMRGTGQGPAIVILFVHDASDVLLDLTKLANYLQLGRTTSALFMLSTYVTWPMLRLWTLPWLIDQYTCGPWWVTGALRILVCLHLYWWALMNRIAYRMWTGQTAQHAARAEYDEST